MEFIETKGYVVAKYLKEYEKLSIAYEVKGEEMNIRRFVGGLCTDLRQKLNTHVNLCSSMLVI